MKFDDEICKGVSCPECSFNKGEDGCLLTKRLDEIEIIPEPCEDAISRQAVLDKKELVELEDGQSFYCISPEDVETLPSVTPQSNTGHWIPVSERLPEPYIGEWLCCTSDGDIMVLPYDTPGDGTKECAFYKWDDRFDFYDTYDVIAWMSLPKPYEPQESEEEK